MIVSFYKKNLQGYEYFSELRPHNLPALQKCPLNANLAAKWSRVEASGAKRVHSLNILVALGRKLFSFVKFAISSYGSVNRRKRRSGYMQKEGLSARTVAIFASFPATICIK